MMMMKERIFAGHPSLVLPPLHLASLALALLALNLLIFAPLTLVNKNGKTQVKTTKRELKWQNAG